MLPEQPSTLTSVRSDKRIALRALGRRRQEADLRDWDRDWDQSYHHVGDYHEGRYDHQEVSPYSKTTRDVDSPVFLLLQDWSSDEMLSKDFNEDVARRGLTPGLRTNTRLEKLPREVFGRDLTEVYGTNLFPFVKPGPISSPIPFAHLVRAAKEFAVPQVEIVRPKLVVCLGVGTYRAVAVALGLPRCQDLHRAIHSAPIYIGEAQVRQRERQQLAPVREVRGPRLPAPFCHLQQDNPAICRCPQRSSRRAIARRHAAA